MVLNSFKMVFRICSGVLSVCPCSSLFYPFFSCEKIFRISFYRGKYFARAKNKPKPSLRKYKLKKQVTKFDCGRANDYVQLRTG